MFRAGPPVDRRVFAVTFTVRPLPSTPSLSGKQLTTGHG